jgi:hypothetical protein
LLLSRSRGSREQNRVPSGGTGGPFAGDVRLATSRLTHAPRERVPDQHQRPHFHSQLMAALRAVARPLLSRVEFCRFHVAGCTRREPRACNHNQPERPILVHDVSFLRLAKRRESSQAMRFLQARRSPNRLRCHLWVNRDLAREFAAQPSSRPKSLGTCRRSFRYAPAARWHPDCTFSPRIQGLNAGKSSVL